VGTVGTDNAGDEMLRDCLVSLASRALVDVSLSGL
jgi:polysaccharide pyruvyl transferase WcaK-like protein